MNTTISIPVTMRDKLQEFGYKGETYADIIKKLYESAKERQLQELLMDEQDTVSVREALSTAQKKWRR
tara:strand:+ start:550 stop:753 length:204 start_codon:yes stop_codon:yes gene_type:complete